VHQEVSQTKRDDYDVFGALFAAAWAWTSGM